MKESKYFLRHKPSLGGKVTHGGKTLWTMMKTVTSAGHAVMSQKESSVSARNAELKMNLSEDLHAYLDRHKEDLTTKEQYFGQMAVNMLRSNNPLTRLVEGFVEEEAIKYARGR